MMKSSLCIAQIHGSLYSVLAHIVTINVKWYMTSYFSFSSCSAPSGHLLKYTTVIPQQREMTRLERCDLDGMKGINHVNILKGFINQYNCHEAVSVFLLVAAQCLMDFLLLFVVFSCKA